MRSWWQLASSARIFSRSPSGSAESGVIRGADAAAGAKYWSRRARRTGGEARVGSEPVDRHGGQQPVGNPADAERGQRSPGPDAASPELAGPADRGGVEHGHHQLFHQVAERCRPQRVVHRGGRGVTVGACRRHVLDRGDLLAGRERKAEGAGEGRAVGAGRAARADQGRPALDGEARRAARVGRRKRGRGGGGVVGWCPRREQGQAAGVVLGVEEGAQLGRALGRSLRLTDPGDDEEVRAGAWPGPGDELVRAGQVDRDRHAGRLGRGEVHRPLQGGVDREPVGDRHLVGRGGGR